ncbi:hypothetical protein BGZ91_006469, partial [Linnemannia elongata]
SGLPVLRDPKYVQRGPTKANQAPISNTAVVDAVPNHQHPPLIPMLQSETPQQGVQVMHLPNKNKTVHISTHLDFSSENKSIHWSDVLLAIDVPFISSVAPKSYPSSRVTTFE